MKGRIITFCIACSLILFTIGCLFWEQELKYARPTPIPQNFHEVKIGQHVDLDSYLRASKKNVVLHFYNPDCSCSRFNMKDFEQFARANESQAQFFVIIQSTDDDAVEKFKKKYELNVPVILDKDGKISDRCGIYSTPQAVILNTNSEIYFKGNYNKTRFCSRKETKFAELALNHLLKNEPLPLFILSELTAPYGCSLPSDAPSEDLATNFLNLN